MASTPKPLTDFPSRLSPMLVKELRQGLRTNMFTVAFILLQAFMVLCLAIGAANPGSNDADGFFWFFVIMSLLIIQPLRGFNALSSEYQLNTMDLIQLTRLDTLRITLGKWTALNAQTLLLFTAILPYLVMRYFLGSVNVFNDLGMLGLIAVGSALASAITIGCSAFKSHLLRVGLLIAGFIGFQFLIGSIGVFSYGGSSSKKWPIIGLVILSAIYGIFFFLSLGASRIAPISENHATRKRIAAILFSIITLCFSFWVDRELVWAFAGVILGLSCIDALTERPPVFSPVLKPFSKSPLARLSAFYLTPGWHTGIFYFIGCVVIWGLGGLFLEPGSISDLAEYCMLVLGFAGTISFPLLFIHLFFKKTTSTQMNFGLYLASQVCLAVITILVALLVQSSNRLDEIVYACIPIPSVILVGLAVSDDVGSLYFVIALILALLLSITIPLIHGRKLYAEMWETFRKK